MPKVAVEHLFTGDTVEYTSYDSTRTMLGKHIVQQTGPSAEDKFAGPMPILLGRPMEQQVATAQAVGFPHVIDIGGGKQLCFLIGTGATNPLRVVMYEFDKQANTFTYIGFVTVAFAAGNATARGFRAQRYLHTTGTVAVSGTGVTGTGTQFQSERIGAGARIGFGSTNPNNITTWYTIAPASAIASNTALTLVENAGTISAGTPYVIEELRIVVSITNATATNGGLYLAKGLHAGLFTSAGTTISLATTVDNIRAVYWLKDAATVTNTVAAGCAIESPVSNTEQYVYVLNGATTASVCYKYNIRASLASLTAGASQSAITLISGTATLVGNQSQLNNGRVATTSHGPGSGSACLYWVTATRIYRALLSGITAGSTTWANDAAVENPPGGSATFALGSAFTSVEYAGNIDRFIVATSGAAGIRSYVTRYITDGSQFDHIFLVDTKQLDQSTADAGGVIHPAVNASTMSVWSEDGYCYLCRNGATAALNQIYIVPLSAHWFYATGFSDNNRLITPAISTPGATKFYRLYVNNIEHLGTGTLGMPPEPYRVYYRTSGITDDSGSWTLLGEGRDLSGVSPAASIQFAFEFKIIGLTCIPGRILGLTVLYEQGDEIPSHLEWNYTDSSLSDGTLGFKQVSSYGSVPHLTISYYRSDNNNLLLTQASTGTTNGVFEYWSGSAWVAGNGTDTVGLRRRFRPTAGLPTNVDVYAKLQLV
jgi:hypothetical protein